MKFKRVILYFLIFFVAFLILDRLYPLDTELLLPKSSPIVYDKNGEIIRIKLNEDGNFFIKANTIPKNLKDSVLYFEDRYFYYHFGINPISIIRAGFYNLTHKNRIGASTITMQVARMMYKNDRNYANKLKEIFRAFQIEWHFSKDEILNFYFNLAPYGGNIQGVKTACKFYFDTDISLLSYSQMALLATIPKNPNKNRPDKNRDDRLKNSVLKRLFKAKVIDKSAYDRGVKEPFRGIRLNAAYNAPEFSDIAFKNGVVYSSLDLGIQRNLLNLLKKTMSELKFKNAHNAAGVVIDNKNMQVVAFVGSHDENSKNGKNSALYMKRNVGSTLKPFVFSLALQNGLITPKSKLIDTEIYINNYTPQNYSNEFLGIVNATNALTFSLNIPPIALNQKLGDNSLYELLNRVGLVSNDKEHYGASIVLGSAEMSLLNLAHLYTIYANEGILKPLNMAGYKIGDKDIRLLDKQSAFLVAKMMSMASRSYLKNVWEYAKNSPKIAFKTGTSYGSRDLYAIGLNKNYTIAIWAGNFDSKKTDGLTGLNDISKVVFEMFKLISFTQKQEFIDEVDGLITKDTCLDPFKFKECKDMQPDEHIVGVGLADRCEFLRGEELDFMLKNGIINLDDIAQSPCFDLLKSKKPFIALPADNQIIISDQLLSKIMIKCYSYSTNNVYLSIDDKPFFKVKSGSENIINLENGRHKIGCLDENLNFKEIKIQIRD